VRGKNGRRCPAPPATRKTVMTRSVHRARRDANLVGARERDIHHLGTHLLLLVTIRNDPGRTAGDRRGHGRGAVGEGSHGGAEE